MFYIWRLYQILEILCVFNVFSSSQLHWPHFKGSNSHVWLIATRLASEGPKHSSWASWVTSITLVQEKVLF